MNVMETMGTTLVGINLLAWVMVKLRPKLYGTKLYMPMRGQLAADLGFTM